MKRASVTNIVAVIAALYFGRCTAYLPESPESFVLCSEVP